jgi:bacterioferritin-associated ferredoxin
MKPDDELCLCFHVTRRKVENYIRVNRPQVPSQLAECYGAGTGCGWCRKILESLWQAAQDKSQPELPDSQTHALGRAAYRDAQKK